MRSRPVHLLLALAALVFAGASQAKAMTFETVSDPARCGGGRCVVASGEITEDTAKAFQRFAKTEQLGRGDVVVFDSTGGDLLASLRLGNIIRKAGLSTSVQAYDRRAGAFKRGGQCASACAYAFLGGVQRSVGEGARIGVHQVYSAGDTWALSAADGMQLMSLVATHVNHLCGNLDVLIPALRTPPHAIYWLSPSELSRYALVTTAPEPRA